MIQQLQNDHPGINTRGPKVHSNGLCDGRTLEFAVSYAKAFLWFLLNSDCQQLSSQMVRYRIGGYGFCRASRNLGPATITHLSKCMKSETINGLVFLLV